MTLNNNVLEFIKYLNDTSLVVVFIMLYKVDLTRDPVDESL